MSTKTQAPTQLWLGVVSMLTAFELTHRFDEEGNQIEIDSSVIDSGIV